MSYQDKTLVRLAQTITLKKYAKPRSKFLYLAYFQQIIVKKERGIPELGLDYASFSTFVEGRFEMSNFMEDYEAILDAKAVFEE